MSLLKLDAEEESCHPESSDSCTGLHAECLWVGKEGGTCMEMERSFFSPHLFAEGGQRDFYLSCHCSGLLPVLKLAGRAGISWCPPFFLPPDPPVTTKLPQCGDLRPGSGGSCAFSSIPTASPQAPSAGSAHQCWVGVAGSLSLPDRSILCSFLLASSLASLPPVPEIQYISILKHYATLYACVAGKKLLSDTHWCY